MSHKYSSAARWRAALTAIVTAVLMLSSRVVCFAEDKIGNAVMIKNWLRELLPQAHNPSVPVLRFIRTNWSAPAAKARPNCCFSTTQISVLVRYQRSGLISSCMIQTDQKATWFSGPVSGRFVLLPACRIKKATRYKRRRPLSVCVGPSSIF